MSMHKEYVDGGNRVKFTRSAVDGHITVRTWDADKQAWTGYTVMGPAEVRDFAWWAVYGEEQE
jgi:hypothetical protein